MEHIYYRQKFHPEQTMSLKQQLRDAFLLMFAEQPRSVCHVFLSASDMQQAFVTRSASDADPARAFDSPWTALSTALGTVQPTAVRADYVIRVIPAVWQDFLERIRGRKPGFWRQGIAIGEDFTLPFTEAELNARDLLIPARRKEEGQNSPAERTSGRHRKRGAPQTKKDVHDTENGSAVNDPAWLRYCAERHGRSWTPVHHTDRVWIFSTRGVFLEEGSEPVRLIPSGRHAGRRESTVSLPLLRQMA